MLLLKKDFFFTILRICFKKGQGLGNQLWQFSAVKSISERLNFNLQISDYKNFKGKKFLKLDIEEFNKYDSELPKEEHKDIFQEFLYYDSKYNYVLSGFDERVFNLKDNTLIDGLFQSEKYFFGDLDKLKKYIKLQDEFIESNYISSDVCILNIRGGESKRHPHILPKSYWENAINNFRLNYGLEKFKIVTDDYLYSKYLFPNIEIIASAPNIEKCYSLIYNCSHVISANSTFSYFPIKTGRKKNVIAPIYWHRPGNNDKRWFSPCNIYKDWYWQDKYGELFSYEECLQSAEASENYYKNRSNILVSQSDIKGTSSFSKISNFLKKYIKKYLSYIFPSYFGNDPSDFTS